MGAATSCFLRELIVLVAPTRSGQGDSDQGWRRDGDAGVRAAGWADLFLVRRRTGQNGEGAELPAVAVRGHQVSLWRGLGEVGVAVGEGRHIPARHAHTVRWLLAVVDRGSAPGVRRCSSRASSPLRRCEVVLVVVLRCSAVSQSRHVGPGGVTRDAATTRRPQSAMYSP